MHTPLTSLFFGLCIDQAEQNKKCIQISGNINLQASSTSPDRLTASYVSTRTLPIFTLNSKINFIAVQAKCSLTSGGFSSAPKCDWDVTLGFCKKSGTCNRNTDTSYRHGSFQASGTGPAAYIISGGTGSFVGAVGSIDSVLNTQTLALSNVEIQLCYNRNTQPEDPPVPSPTTPPPSPTRPTRPSFPSINFSLPPGSFLP